MKKRALFLVMLLCTAVFANDLPGIAVYVTGDVPENEKSALGTRMLASLVNSGRYRGIERTGSFLAEIEKELAKQRSGDVDDGQISKLGKMFGVKFVCIAAITPAFGSYQVSARIVDVETAEVVFIGESASALETMDDLTDVSNKVVKDMFGGQARAEEKPGAPIAQPKPPKPPKSSSKSAFWLGIGLDAAGAGIIAYGIIENENVKSHDLVSKAEKSAKIRDIAYIAGASFLLAGISVHIFF